MNGTGEGTLERTFVARPLADVLSSREEPAEPSPETYVETAGWDPEETVRTTTRPLSTPRVAVTPDGTVHLLWVEEGWLWHSVRIQDAWGEPRRLFAGMQPSVTVDGQGNVHMVFVHDFGGRYQVYYTRYREPLWALPYEISRTPGLSHNPHIAAAANGLLYVVWEDDTPGFPSIYHAYNPEGHWINAPVPGARGWRPSVTCDGKGDIHLVWESTIPNQQGDDIYHSQLTSSGWSLPENISDSPNGDSALPKVAGAPDGTVHVVWQEKFGPRSAIGYASGRYASWFKPLAITGGGYHQDPQIAVSHKGDVHVMWVDQNILAYRSRGSAPDAPWHTAQRVGVAPQGISHLSLVCDAQGGLHAVWVRREDDTHVLCYRHRKAAAVHKEFIPTVVG